MEVIRKYFGAVWNNNFETIICPISLFRIQISCLSFFFWPLCCLFFFDLGILITPLVSSNSSYMAGPLLYLYTMYPLGAIRSTRPFEYISHTLLRKNLNLFRCFGFIAPKTLNYLAFQSFGIGLTWWRLFQTRVVRFYFYNSQIKSFFFHIERLSCSRSVKDKMSVVNITLPNSITFIRIKIPDSSALKRQKLLMTAVIKK